MVCGFLAVQRLKLDANVAEEILRAAEPMAALEQFVTEVLVKHGATGAYTVSATINEARTYAVVTVKDARGAEHAQVVIYTQAYAGHSGRRLTDPKLVIQGPNRTLVDQLAPDVEAFAAPFAMALKKTRTRLAVRARLTVTEEVTLPSGAIIQRVQV